MKSPYDNDNFYIEVEKNVSNIETAFDRYKNNEITAFEFFEICDPSKARRIVQRYSK